MIDFSKPRFERLKSYYDAYYDKPELLWNRSQILENSTNPSSSFYLEWIYISIITNNLDLFDKMADKIGLPKLDTRKNRIAYFMLMYCSE